MKRRRQVPPNATVMILGRTGHLETKGLDIAARAIPGLGTPVLVSSKSGLAELLRQDSAPYYVHEVRDKLSRILDWRMTVESLLEALVTVPEQAGFSRLS